MNKFYYYYLKLKIHYLFYSIGRLKDNIKKHDLQIEINSKKIMDISNLLKSEIENNNANDITDEILMG